MRISSAPVQLPLQQDGKSQRPSQPVQRKQVAPELSHVEKKTLLALFSPASKGSANYAKLENMPQRIRLGQYVDTKA
jgi:hypothetical protein